MPHLIETIRNSSILEAILKLEKTHDLIANKAIATQLEIGTEYKRWGAKLKRLEVNLPVNELLVGKASEKFVEVISILATTERTITTLKWFSRKYPNSILQECHPSTSDDIGGNDIVLIDNTSKIVVRCEVTDVISNNAAQNNKEKKDLKNLQCEHQVPEDDVDRDIATSLEFANALSSPKRK